MTSFRELIRSAFGGRPSNGTGAGEASNEQEQQPKLSTQLDFPEDEKKALALWIDQAIRDAWDDHNVRIDRCAEQEKLWREKVGLEGGEEGLSNFRVPLTTALVMAKHARETEAISGQNPTIECKPKGPYDTKQARKVGLSMQWQVYENMAGTKPLALCSLRRLKHGRSFAKIEYKKKFYTRKVAGRIERVCYHEGPELLPLNNDEIILPASVEGKANWDSVQTAEWVGLRYWDTPANMLHLESKPSGAVNPEGDYYQGVRANWKRIVEYSRQPYVTDWYYEPSKYEKDLSEGVMRDENSTATRREQVEILEMHCRWRRWVIDRDNEETADDSNSENRTDDGRNPAGIGPDSSARVPDDDMGYDSEDSADRYGPGVFRDSDGRLKEVEQTNLIVRMIRNIQGGNHLIVGIQDADEVYPDTCYKRPIFEMALLNDGHYWCMGLVELCEEIEKELNVLVNRILQAHLMSIGPPILAEPTMGETALTTKYEAFEVIWVSNTAGAKVLDIKPTSGVLQELWQLFQTIWELLTGITNFTFGRSLDQPNTPRTLGGQRLVMGAGDVRLALDMRMLSEDLTVFLAMVWDYWTMFGNEQEAFRVAQGDIQGLFEHGELQNGWATLDPKEREGRYDWSLKFADDAGVREAKKQEATALAGIAMQSPLVQQNPVIQYRLLVDVFEAFGKDFTKYSNEPPPPFAPRTPEEEWLMLLKKQDISVHPNDDDEAHILDFENRILAMYNGPEDQRKTDVMLKAKEHIEQHKEQGKSKAQMQELVQGVGQLLQASQAGINGAGGAPKSPMDGLMALIGQQGNPQQNQPQPGA